MNVFNPNGPTQAELKRKLKEASPRPASAAELLMDLQRCRNSGEAYISSNLLWDGLPFEISGICDAGNGDIAIKVFASEMTSDQWRLISEAGAYPRFASEVLAWYDSKTS